MKKLEFISEGGKISSQLGKRGLPYNYAQRLLRNKDVRVDNIKIDKDISLPAGCEVTVFYEEQVKTIEKIYEDDNIIIVNKPSGIEVEGEGGVAKTIKAIAVHRLDRNTTGLLILAKNDEAEKELNKAIKNRTITKKYLAEVVGASNFNGEKSAYLVKDSDKSLVKIFDKSVKNSVLIKTIFRTLKSNPSSSIVECTLVTGKTHQIRAQLAHLGHPIIGDGKYGRNEDNKKFKKSRQQLHSYYLKLNGLEGKLSYLNGQEFINYPAFFKNQDKN